jgi:N-acetylmuramoyl-L-alanine amidase
VTVADGWYDGARRVDAHRGRVGGTIDPEVIVVHTTDCMPGSMPAIVKSWSSVAGNGACAHAIIGRTPVDGMVQMIPFTRNANHAGGYPGHGWYLANNAPARAAGAPLVHPNTIAVGIELDCAGYLGRPVNSAGRQVWLHPDTKREIAASDVDVDEQGRGWHKVTQYQYDTLGNLIDELRAGMRLPRPGLTISPNGTYADNGVKWADVGARVSVVGHVTLDPLQKTDPGPFVMGWLAAHFV